MRLTPAIVLSLSLLLPSAGSAAKKAPDKDGGDANKDVFSSGTFTGLKLRGIGPALTSGRIVDFAVDPSTPSHYYVASASGGVWTTVDGGTTYTPVFDSEGSYSIGCVTIDPNNPHTVWVGTGENNSQRSVSWGDGVYRSDDDGQHWTNMGLKDSQHIGRILVDPRDSNVIYVAAQGPLWGPGGDRGLYKSTDGGATWKAVLTISENTGVTEVAMDPRNPDVLYAASYQRRRRVWGLIDGGPESAIYKSTDAGKTWKKLTSGLPKVDMGRIGITMAPANPDVIYAVIEAAEDKGGIFRSDDRGATWTKRSDYTTTSGQYYNELVCDPKDVDTVYSMDTWLHVTHDGGKTWDRVGEKTKHVDNHGMWIDPSDTAHFLVGCDGGVYETYDAGRTWNFKTNLPVTQFYRVAVDNSKPFYYVYGGTQDNFSLGGPSRTTSQSGITSADWFVTTGGDGFVSRIDPVDPTIVYAESQYGGLVRYDRKSGEEIGIRPEEGKGEAPFRFNWDSPLIISPHSHTRLYFAAQQVFQSDDRGDTWTEISGDLSRQLDRNTMKIMGRVWPVDAVAKNASTSFYGSVVTLSESPLVEGLLYAGTDDGLIQVRDGATWRKIGSFPGVPELTYVSGITASMHNADTVYACFDNHKSSDFKPYLLKSTDRGRTWKSIASDLPDGEVVYALAEDPTSPDLLYIGCELGVYFSTDGGGHWVKLTGGMPTIAVRDLTVQKRDNDLVLATFGRGFYVLDDLSPLQHTTRETLDKDAVLYPVRDALAYIERSPLGGRGASFQGDSFYFADNPPFGAVFTYYLKDGLKTRAELRRDAEKAAIKKGENPAYPSVDELRAESREPKPAVVLTVTDSQGNVIQRVEGPTSKGFHRVAWNLRYPPFTPARLHSENGAPWEWRARGPMAVPGTYKVTLAKRVDTRTTELAGPAEFKVVPIDLNSLADPDRAALVAFQLKTARLQRAVLGARDLIRQTQDHLKLIHQALKDTPAPDAALLAQADALRSKLDDLSVTLSGDEVRADHNMPVSPSIIDRVQGIVYGEWSATAAPTTTQQKAYDIAGEEFTGLVGTLRTLVEKDLAELEKGMDAAGSPWTPGRVPDWQPE